MKISISSTISIAIRKSTSAPATANEFISTPNSCNNPSPMKKKRVSNKNEYNTALNALIALPCSRIVTITGIAPIGSITAKSTIKALKKSRRLNVDNI